MSYRKGNTPTRVAKTEL